MNAACASSIALISRHFGKMGHEESRGHAWHESHVKLHPAHDLSSVDFRRWPGQPQAAILSAGRADVALKPEPMGHLDEMVRVGRSDTASFALTSTALIHYCLAHTTPSQSAWRFCLDLLLLQANMKICGKEIDSRLQFCGLS
jgi:hypothetical protein